MLVARGEPGRGGQEDLDIIIKNPEIYEASIQMD